MDVPYQGYYHHVVCSATFEEVSSWTLSPLTASPGEQTRDCLNIGRVRAGPVGGRASAEDTRFTAVTLVKVCCWQACARESITVGHSHWIWRQISFRRILWRYRRKLATLVACAESFLLAAPAPGC